MIQADGRDVGNEAVRTLVRIDAGHPGGVPGIPVVEGEQQEIRIQRVRGLQQLHLVQVRFARSGPGVAGGEVVVRVHRFAQHHVDACGHVRQDDVGAVQHDRDFRVVHADRAYQRGGGFGHAGVAVRVRALEGLGVVQGIQEDAVEALDEDAGDQLFDHARRPAGIAQIDVMAPGPVGVFPQEQALVGDGREVGAVVGHLTQTDVAEQDLAAVAKGLQARVDVAVEHHEIVGLEIARRRLVAVVDDPGRRGVRNRGGNRRNEYDDGG